MDKSEDTDLIFRGHFFSRYSLLSECLVFYRLPYKADVRYKLYQVYLVFLSRVRQIYKKKLFYYLPVIFFALLASCIFYILKRNPNKAINFFNSKNQNLFDKITKNSAITVVNIISSIQGGGAEVLVSELHKIYLNKNLHSYIIYFDNNFGKKKQNHFYLNLNPRNPISIFYIRKIIKQLLYTTNKEIIIHVHLTWPFFFTVIAVLGLKNLKLFFTEHDTFNRRRKIPFFYFIERLFYKRYLNIVCISRGVYRELIKWLGSTFKARLKIIYNGSRLFSLSQRPKLKNRLPKLISVGRLIPKKNFLTTIMAVSKLKKDIDSYTIVGDGPGRKKIESLIKSLKLQNKIKLVGWVKKVENYYKKSDIHLIPSLYEGFGLVAAEGMSTGLTVVASNISGLKEVVGYENNSTFLVNQIKSSQQWKKKILEAIRKLKSIGTEKMGIFSSIQSQKFDLNRMANEYLNMYKKN